jgi:hypothetical protein
VPIWALVLALSIGLVLLGAGLVLAGLAVGLWARRPAPATSAPPPIRSVPPPPTRRTGPPPIDRTLRPPVAVTPAPLGDAGPTEWLPRSSVPREGDSTQRFTGGMPRDPEIEDA